MSPGQVPANIEAKAGTYALLFECDISTELTVGRLSRIQLNPGIYCYVGSALGSGGVRARVRRQLQPTPRKHWHIDYLRGALRPSRVIFAYNSRRLEHAWANALLRLSGGDSAMAGFGASDCRCLTHLIFFQGWPERAQFREALRGASPRSAELQEILIG